MKRILFTLLIAISGLATTAQTFPYNNEWIDYSKTYYKFYVGRTGLYRISHATLSAAGIGSTPAEHFQLWRNGQQIAIYTSTASGPLGSGDYIEFWGEQNDGRPDSTLYRDRDYILNDKYSLQTDTVAFFLTVNPAGGNIRLANTVNNVAGNILPPDPYFMFTEGKYFRDYINPGYFIDAGEYVHSSSYDKGESWVCADIYTGLSRTEPHTLYPYSSGPDATFRINLFGNGINQRRYRVKINADSILGQQLDFLNQAKASATVPLTTLLSGANTVEITNLSPGQYDRLVVGQYELNYPRVFDFGGTINFEFELQANPAGNYLEITNFNYGSTAPVLYDLTNNKRYIGDISNPSLLKFALEPSLVDRKLVLISLEPLNINAINAMQSRDFYNYSLAPNQADYIIISHPLLYAGPGGSNPVEDYRAYRSSVAGGGFNAGIFEIDELVDQFAFGVKKHPNSIRNFLRWARVNFSVTPKYVFLIGHAVVYDQYRYAEYYSDANVEKLNLVPTFGAPASDILLTADVRQQIPLIPIGRLSVIDGGEVATYLAKVQEYEATQAVSSPLVQDKAWMKNVVHVIGGNDPVLVNQLTGYMNKYRQIISDTLFGGNVNTFKKSSTEIVQQIADQRLKDLFAEGLNQVIYFGHSSATVLDFNLDNPEQYDNPGKYPFFVAMGCLAGNFFNYNGARFYTKETLSEKWVLTPHRGAIAFLASSHFGIPHYLDIYNTKTYTNESRLMYGKSYGEILRQSIIDVFAQTSQLDFYARMHTEQNTLHGDPALRPNTHLKPDYVIEDPMVKLTPSFISIAETSFQLDVRYINQGKAIKGNIAIEIKRQLPDGTIITVLKDTIPAIRYQDSISVTLPINPTTDRGLNKIIVTIDADNAIDELYETNNTITKDVFIFEDDARPVYPLNYAIINQQNIKLYASTANPFSPSKQYRMEMDTTALFNSAFKRTVSITAPGGLLEFEPAVTFTDSTVYYWRVSPLDGTGNPSKWNEASFVYLPNSDVGFNQSHFFQHTKSLSERVFIDSSTRKWDYHPVLNNLFIRTAIYPTGSPNQADYTVTVNGDNYIGPGCNYDELIINVFDPVSFQPWKNTTGTLYNSSWVFCGIRRDYNFHYFLSDTMWRRRAQEFLENIVPDGAYVVIRSNTAPYPGINHYAAEWQGDTAFFGPGNSLYHTLKNQGFTSLDQYDTTNCFIFVYKKNSPQYTPSIMFSQNIYERLLMSVGCPTPDTLGYTTSPVFGAAKQWKQFKWRGSTVDAVPGDLPTIDLVGINNDGIETTVMSNLDLSQQDVDISSIDAAQYPYLKLRIRNLDSVNLTPYQLRYWRLTYVPIPEGAVAPNVFFQFKDTLEAGEPLDFKLAFKNISEGNFDSLRVKMIITDKNNVQTTIPSSRFRPLPKGDTLHVRNLTNTATLTGLNTFYLDVNPDNDQPEQFHFNNFMYRNFYVRSDNVNPLLDVTFDGVHILNRDIVASKPHIIIKLKDESRWLLLNDTAGANIRVRYPNGVIRPFYFNMNDTVKFSPAGSAPNPDNTATIDFTPHFPLDGDYELIVTGKDRSGNTAGNVEYKVGFQIINKPMISNMLNYPNPFTTSTAFVFTITGAEVPQNIRIQIMTVTGKIVREITKDELGPLHIGRNITEFKWDGTDQYGQKLANGIYLYRVITNLNGRSLDKYKAEGDETDKYFNKGYGKMYLMR